MGKLKKCSDCGHEISKKAKSCPNCGYTKSKKTSLFTWFALVSIIAIFILSESNDSLKNNTTEKSSSNLTLENKEVKKLTLKEQKVNEEIKTIETISHTKLSKKNREKLKRKLMIENSKSNYDYLNEAYNGLKNIDKLKSYKKVSLGNLNTRLEKLRNYSKIILARKRFSITKKDIAYWEKVNKFRIKVQIKHFPKMRDALGPLMRVKMWEHDTDVRTIGKKYKTMVLTSAVFASNRNIKNSFEAIKILLNDYRFNQVDFKWIKNAEEWQIVQINTLSDKE